MLLVGSCESSVTLTITCYFIHESTSLSLECDKTSSEELSIIWNNYLECCDSLSNYDNTYL